MFTINSTPLDLSAKYGELGNSIFDIIKKYDGIEINSVDEKQDFIENLKFIIDSNIDFNDKLVLINSMVNGCQNMKDLLF